jgi:hypothetical protein
MRGARIDRLRPQTSCTVARKAVDEVYALKEEVPAGGIAQERGVKRNGLLLMMSKAAVTRDERATLDGIRRPCFRITHSKLARLLGESGKCCGA